MGWMIGKIVLELGMTMVDHFYPMERINVTWPQRS
jgi:hypothetical protein